MITVSHRANAPSGRRLEEDAGGRGMLDPRCRLLLLEVLGRLDNVARLLREGKTGEARGALLELIARLEEALELGVDADDLGSGG